MYKKILLASAISLVATGSNAATWGPVVSTTATPIHTREGIQADVDTAGVATSSALVELGAEYALNDLMTFTLNMDKATTSYWPTTIYGQAAGTVDNGLLHADVATGATNPDFDAAADNIKAVGTLEIGDLFTIAGDTQKYRVMANAGGDLTISPGIKIAASDGDAITTVDFKDMTLTLVNGGTSAATYRVSTLGTGTTTVGVLLAIPDVAVKQAGLQTQNAKVSFSASTAGGTAMDTLATSATIARAISTWTTVNTTIFNGVVDVEKDKKEYSDGKEDVIKVTITEGVRANGVATPAVDNGFALTYAGTPAGIQAGTTSAKTTVTGDFAFLDDTAATAGVQTSQGSAATDEIQQAGTGCTTAVATTGLAVVLTDTISDHCQATIRTGGVAIIPTQSFTGTTVFTYTPNTGAAVTKTLATAAFGSWTLNGASVTAYGVPMGASVARHLWINNKGAADAVFTYSATMNGTTYGPYALGTMPGKQSTKISSLIDADLAARGVTILPSSRATITVDAPVKAGDITVSAAYKHIGDADRLALETSDTIDGTTK